LTISKLEKDFKTTENGNQIVDYWLQFRFQERSSSL